MYTPIIDLTSSGKSKRITLKTQTTLKAAAEAREQYIKIKLPKNNLFTDYRP